MARRRVGIGLSNICRRTWGRNVDASSFHGDKVHAFETLVATGVPRKLNVLDRLIGWMRSHSQDKWCINLIAVHVIPISIRSLIEDVSAGDVWSRRAVSVFFGGTDRMIGRRRVTTDITGDVQDWLEDMGSRELAHLSHSGEITSFPFELNV